MKLENIQFKINDIFKNKIKKYNFYTINTKIKKKKFYCLSMFPYPSGKLHIGHIRNYTISDIISKYKRQKNYYVFNPIGWDSFGTPAENAAKIKNIDPKIWTEENIKIMKFQLKELEFSFDWEKEIKTSNFNYYKWEQLFITKLYNSNLVYKKKKFVNWDPIEKTVLSDEQVINGLGWRSNSLIERKKIFQWYIKITSYADDLLNDIYYLNNWSNKVKDMQKNWINKTIGYEIKLKLRMIKISFKIFIENVNKFYYLKNINFFHEHELYEYYNKQNNYNKFFNISFNSIRNQNILINFNNNEKFKNDINYEILFKNDFKNIFINIKINIIDKIIFKILRKKKLVKIKELFNIKDWCISRQRYWGTPIPIIKCNNCNFVSDKKKNLPVILPKFNEIIFKNINLKNINSFLIIKCNKCKEKSKRECDVFDTFLQSSWYYIKYLFNKNSIESNLLNFWLPVNQYIGGIEHANLHLIYSRFFHKLMKDFNIINSLEPFYDLLTQGMVLLNGSKMSKSKGNIIDQDNLIKKYGIDTLRMFVIFSAPPEQSFNWKEKGIIGCKRFLDKILNFSIYLNCLSNKIKNRLLKKNNYFIINDFNYILKKINYNLNKKKIFNNIISLTMKLYKKISNFKIIDNNNFILIKKIFENIIIILHPISPQITHYIWNYILNKKNYIINEKFPKLIYNVKKKYININLIIQINGKFKGLIKINNKNIKKNIYNLILNNLNIKKKLQNKNIKKIIVIKSKIFNILTY